MIRLGFYNIDFRAAVLPLSKSKSRKTRVDITLDISYVREIRYIFRDFTRCFREQHACACGACAQATAGLL